MNASERRALHLSVFDDAAGGLNFLLSDHRSLALHERQVLPADALARWGGPAWQLAATSHAELLAFGLTMAQALIPASVREVLARQPGGWLHLQLSPAQLAWPWELAALPPSPPARAAGHLDDHFTVVRQIMASGAPTAAPRHREPGALLQVLHLIDPASPSTSAAPGAAAPQPGRFGPLVVRVHATGPGATSAWQPAVGLADIVHLHAGCSGDSLALTALSALTALLLKLPAPPRLLLAEGLPAAEVAAQAMALCRAGLSTLLLAEPAPGALAVFYAALAGGASFGAAAQQARAAARADHGPGADAWFYGDGPMTPLHPAAALAAPLPGGAPRATPAGDDLRQITILSCDLVDSTGLMHRLGDEEYSERLTHYHRRVAEAAQQHGGLADDPQGDDGFMCYFGHPVASEDAAAQALRAGLQLSGQFDDLGLRVRIGIATGRVVIRQGQPVGAAVHHAARLQQHAGAGGVLVSEATRQIAGERFAFTLETAVAQFKGFDGGGPVYRLRCEQALLGTERFDARAQLTPFTGREAELARLQQAWAAAMAGRRQVLLLRGEAGIGKSRLVHEFRRGLAAAGHRTLECRCAPEHAGSAFQPMIDLLRNRLKISAADTTLAQIARLRQLQVTSSDQADAAIALLGRLLSLPADALPPLPDADSPERLRHRTMDLLLQIAQGLDQQAPVCLLVEDVHWIDPSTRALVQRLIDGPPQQRVLLLLTLRNSPVDRPAELSSKPSSKPSSNPPADGAYAVPELVLGGLGADAARALLQGAIGSAMLDTDLAGWLTQRADGVPLFIEESARMAASLTAQQPAADISAALRDAVPSTLQDLLMARLDQLPLARRAAQLGSALGRSFSWAQIEAVNRHEASPIRLAALPQALDALVQSGLLGEQQDAGQRAFAFKHALVRDAAYQSMLERDRRRLHASIAAVLQAQFGPLCSSRPELLAQHQAQAGLVTQALQGWARAARHAARRSADGEAVNHLRSALALLAGQADSRQRDRAELGLQWRLASRLRHLARSGATDGPAGADPVLARVELLCQRLAGGSLADQLLRALQRPGRGQG